jgi:hypothetical protein
MDVAFLPTSFGRGRVGCSCRLGAAVATPDGHGVAVELVDVVQGVAFGGVDPGGDVGAGFTAEWAQPTDNLGEPVVMAEQLQLTFLDDEKAAFQAQVLRSLPDHLPHPAPPCRSPRASGARCAEPYG